MGLNIKNQRVHDLARQAALLTGQSQTAVIEEALVRLLKDYGADPSQQRTRTRIDLVHNIVARYAQAPGDPRREIRRPEDLYDDTGLPR